MKLTALNETFAIARLNPSDPIPEWAHHSEFFSINKTQDELSIVCSQNNVPKDIQHEKDWRALKVEGPLDFSLTGILYSLTKPLAEQKISLFAISTFDTDYILVKSNDFTQACKALSETGFTVAIDF
ncbi:ACT domain-containing protein [bacterium]|nr:ACT domain-containing protein [bacterium]